MSTASWAAHTRAAVGKAWRKARMLAWWSDVRRDMREAKRAAGRSGWWSDLQDHWAAEEMRWGERWNDGDR